MASMTRAILTFRVYFLMLPIVACLLLEGYLRRHTRSSAFGVQRLSCRAASAIRCFVADAERAAKDSHRILVVNIQLTFLSISPC